MMAFNGVRSSWLMLAMNSALARAVSSSARERIFLPNPCPRNSGAVTIRPTEGSANLLPEQLSYAAEDVLHLHRLQEKFDEILVREGRKELAYKCFDFLPVRAELDLAGWPNTDIFEH